MAGGRGKNKQSGNLDRIHQWLYCHQLYATVKPELPSSETFKKHQHIEKGRIITKSLCDLQDNILRLLYSNTNLLKEEKQLVDHILSTYTSNIVNSPSANKVLSIDQRYADCTTLDCHSKSIESSRNVREYATVDISPTVSDMADSGLETGSVSPHENTTSENWTDFEVLEVTEYTSGNDESDKIHPRRTRNKDHNVTENTDQYNSSNSYNTSCHIKEFIDSGLMECTSNDHSATCSSDAEQPQLDSSSSSTENAHKAKSHTGDIFHRKSRVLSDPFYESDCGSDENESFVCIDLGNASSANADVETRSAKGESAEKLRHGNVCHSSYSPVDNAQSENTIREVSHDARNQKSSSNTSNYYFIDASTLNDEIEVPSSNIVINPCYDEKVQSHASYSSKYVASTSTYHITDEQCYKFTPFKTVTIHTGHEKIAEFERELKLKEYLEPVADTRKVGRADPTSEEKVITETNKESLAVEIKEADSGESAHPSPCPDNNKNINNDRHITRINDSPNVEVGAKNETKEQTNDKDTNVVDDTRRPSLIRRNTFELDSNDEKLSVLRQEYERRQGNLVFQNAIPQYSGHRVDGDSCFNPPDEPPPSIPISNVLKKFAADVQIPSSSQYRTIPYVPLDNGKYEINQTSPENNDAVQSNINETNVIYPVTKSASDEVVADYHVELDNGSSNCSNSLPVTLGCIIENSKGDTLKRVKCDETTPIISGGVSTTDYSKLTDSPTVRRKTESTPIISGGSVVMGEPEVKMRPTRMSSSMTAWVVDMSDCNRNEQKLLGNTYAGMSQSFSSSECMKKKQARKISAHDKHGSLGFFVNLKDMDSKPVSSQGTYPVEKTEQNDCSKSYCEFYVDMSSTSSVPKNKKLEIEETVVKPKEFGDCDDKTSIFSMYIDFSDTSKSRETPVPPSHRRGFSAFSDKRIETKLEDTNSNESSIVATTKEDQLSAEQAYIKEKAKPSVFMYIESDSPVVRRRTLSSSRPAFKRHSWNVDKTQGYNNNGHVAKEIIFRKEHKRAHSLSVDRGDLKKLQAKPSTSSHSLSDTTKQDPVVQRIAKVPQEGNNGPNNMDTSSEDVCELDVTPPNSHVEVINEELRVSVKEHEYTELKAERITENLNASDVKAYEDEYSETSAWEKTYTESTEGQTRKSETFDISSGSGPSPESDNHDFELSELLNGEVPNINRPQVVPAVGNKISETHKSLNETIKKIESELKDPDYVKTETVYESHTVTVKKNERAIGHNLRATSNFVRLSDLDKTPVASHSTDTLTMKEDRSTYRMCNSIPETSWIESKLVMSRTNGSIRSLPRKFTSLMSTSLPPKQKSPLEELTGEYDGEGIISESDLSSMQSSMGRSGAEGSTEETETSSLAGSRPYNRLGEDLLRMFLEEINPDVTIDVAGRRIRAHKCILSSRCQYFAAILSGGWIESVGNVISLQGYSYDAVHFALCHIYSGESNIPDSISIVELATLADMLCLEGLKEIIGYTLKVKYCHLFHKPCQICAVGVLECMPLAAAYGLDEVYRKSLRWITRHFVRIWPCKEFATLPKELMAKCYHQHIVHMSTDNVLQTMMDCDKLLATLPNVRWAEPVFRMVSNLLETSVKYLSDNFSGVLGNENFQSLGRELTWNISRLEDNFLAAAERLPPEQACKSYSKLHKMLTSTQQDEAPEKIKWGSLFVDFLKKIQGRVEKCLVRDAERAAKTSAWLKMDLELRGRIQELACLVILPHEVSKRQSRHSNFIKEPRPASSRSLTTNRSLDLKRVKMVISEHNHKTQKLIAQQQQQQQQQQQPLQQQPKKVINKPKSDPLERKMQSDKQTTDTSRPKSWPNKLEVKSRYLEPRNKSVPKETTQTVQQEKVMVQQRRKIMISSSDSSRTSSPAMKRATDKKALSKIKFPVKKDVKALSSDSLTESNANRTNTKKDSISKSCGITRPESPSFKQKSTEIGLSVDSLAESKNKPTTIKKKTNKMDTSMSTDSLMTEVTTTPKSTASNKLSPTLGKAANKTQPFDKGTKKSSPPMQQRSPLTVIKRPRKSLESSTAASRSRAAAISAYHLRRNLLDAAKTPDVPSKSLNNVPSKLVTTRPVMQSTVNHPNIMREKRDGVPNQQGSESPNKRSSLKPFGINKINKSMVTNRGATSTKTTCDEKIKNKCHNGEVSKPPTVGSRSGTFLKDEPTILKKADIKSSQIDT